jgi:hypothetical protein
MCTRFLPKIRINKFEDNKGVIRSHKSIQWPSDTKAKKDKGQERQRSRETKLKTITCIYKTLHIKRKIEQHEPHKNQEWNKLKNNTTPNPVSRTNILPNKIIKKNVI